MRFDEVSAEYSNFGIFMVGVRTAVKDLGTLLEGTLPQFDATPLTR
jgi:chlorite dismutase